MLQGLKYKIKAVRKFEKDNRKKIRAEEEVLFPTMLDVINGILALDVSAMVTAIMIGLETSEEKAEDLIQEELDSDRDTIEVADDIITALVKSGFMKGALSKIKLVQIFENKFNQALTQIEAPVQEEETQDL